MQVFRRQASDFYGRNIKLSGLDSAARYELNNLDAPEKTVVTGKELM